MNFLKFLAVLFSIVSFSLTVIIVSLCATLGMPDTGKSNIIKTEYVKTTDNKKSTVSESKETTENNTFTLKAEELDNQSEAEVETNEDTIIADVNKNEEIKKSVLLNVPNYDQRNLGYPTGCEIVSLAMMINYIEVKASVKTLISKMPLSSNPNEGFRGNPATSNGFTIFPQALLKLTDEYIGNSHDMSGCEMKDLKEKLSAETPLVAWVCGLGFNVHAICLTGYDEKGFYYNDPWTGKKNTFITYDSFYAIWNKSIKDEVLNITYPARKALSYYK